MLIDPLLLPPPYCRVAGAHLTCGIIGLRIYLIIALGLLSIKATGATIDSFDASRDKYSSPDNLLRFYDRLRHLVSFLKRSLEYAIYAIILTLVIQQVESIANLAQND